MGDIKDTVGGANSQVQDIAMVQMMLKVIKDAKGVPYLKGNYSGTWDNETKDSITSFQKDQGLIAPPPVAGKVAAPAAGAGVKTDKAGVVELNSATLQKLNALLPAAYKDALILLKAKTVYIAGDAKAAKKYSGLIRHQLELDATFRGKAADFVDEFYNRTKIVLSPAYGKNGLRRTFEDQMHVNAQAGPGESNHQFGQAADIGFHGLKWVDGDGTIRTEAGDWPKNMPDAKRTAFYDAHHDVSQHPPINLFLSTLPGDQLHVQAYPDNSLSYSKSLAQLLNTTPGNTMKWEGMPHIVGQENKYKSDLALGGQTYVLGKAKEIYPGNAKVNPQDVAAALNTSTKDLSQLPVYKDFKWVKDIVNKAKPTPGKPPAPVTGAAIKVTDITEADLILLRAAAQSDWTRAEANWRAWKAIK